MNKIVYTKGDKIGKNLIYIEEAQKGKHGRKANFQCHCGNFFITTIQYVKDCKTTSCGCLSSRNTFNARNVERSTKHGLEKHPLYKRFRHMLDRCYKETNNRFYTYGARGIKVEPYLQKLENYITYIESLPNAYGEGLSVDRIDNDKGYQRGNLRWVNSFIQNANKSNAKK